MNFMWNQKIEQSSEHVWFSEKKDLICQKIVSPVSNKVDTIVSWNSLEVVPWSKYLDCMKHYYKMLWPDFYAVLASPEKFLSTYTWERALHLPINEWDIVPSWSVTWLALNTWNHVRAYKSAADSKFWWIPYSWRSSAIYENQNWKIEKVWAISVVTSTKFEESVMQECESMMSYILIMESVIERMTTGSNTLENCTNQITSIWNIIKTEVLSQILSNVKKLDELVKTSNTLSYNSQIVALRAWSETFKVIAKEISQQSKSIWQLLIRITSLWKKIKIIVEMIERLMIRIHQFAQTSVSEWVTIVNTIQILANSINSFKSNLEIWAFQTVTENLSIEEIVTDNKKRTHYPDKQQLENLPAILSKSIDLLPVLSILVDWHILIWIPAQDKNWQLTWKYIAWSHWKKPIPWFDIKFDEPVPSDTVLYKTIVENRDVRIFIPQSKSSYWIAYICSTTRIFDDNWKLIWVKTLVLPWDWTESIQNKIQETQKKIESMKSYLLESATRWSDMKHIVHELQTLIWYLGTFSINSTNLWKRIIENEPWLQQLRLACNIEWARSSNKEKGWMKDSMIDNDFSTAWTDLWNILKTFSFDANKAIDSMKYLSDLVSEINPIISSVAQSQSDVAINLDEINWMTKILWDTILELNQILENHMALLQESTTLV